MIETIDIPKISDTRGNLSVIEKDTIPFQTKRVYYLYDIPSGTFSCPPSILSFKFSIIAPQIASKRLFK